MMESRINYKEVTPEMLSSLLTAHSWNIIKVFPDKATVWECKDSLETIWVPITSDIDDYPSIVEQTITKISKNDSLNKDFLIDELCQKYKNSDLIKFRLIGDVEEDGKISFKDCAASYNAINTIVCSAVNSAKEITSDIKDRFFTESTFNQTQIGSYVISINTPLLEQSLEKNGDQFNNLEQPLFGRDLNWFMFNRLKYLRSKLENFKESNIGKDITELLSHRVTKTELEAFASLFGCSGNRDWEFEIIWAKELSKPSSKIFFNKSNLSPIKRILTEINSKTEVEDKRTLYGRVVMLKRDYDITNGTIEIITTIGNKSRTIKAVLDAELYHEAQEANDEQVDVKVVGQLTTIKTKTRTSYCMTEVDSLERIQPDLLDK